MTESALEFPCRFPIKAVGHNSAELDLHLVEIIRRHVDDLTMSAVTSKQSRGGKYLSVTVTITAHSQQQLDAIYRDLSASPRVLMAL